MLRIHVLDVGHGDSIVIEHRPPDGPPSFGLIDSNQLGPGDPPALRKLRELGAERLNFVALTHPHADHYKGLLSVLMAYEGRIDMFLSFPVAHYTPGRLKKLAARYLEICERTDSATVRGQLGELIRILEFAHKLGPNWQEPQGWMGDLPIGGFVGVDLYALLPPAKVKGAFFELIIKGTYEPLKREKDDNDLSLAFLAKYAGVSVVLGGDGTMGNWIDHRKNATRRNVGINAAAVKLPHHGAENDSNAFVIDHLFAKLGERIALISADGISHPHPKTYKALEDRGIAPYCTSLAKQCGARYRELGRVGGLNPALDRFISTVIDQPTERNRQPCQGDICMEIDSSGGISISSQFGLPCPYRGGYGFALAP